MNVIMWIIDNTDPAGQPSSSTAIEVNSKDEITGKRSYMYICIINMVLM